VTDFLTSLAARSLGQETIVQPRLRALFEPVGSIEAEPTGLEQEVETVAEPPPTRRRSSPRGSELAVAPPPAVRTEAPSQETGAPETGSAVSEPRAPAGPRSLEAPEHDSPKRERDPPAVEVRSAPRRPAPSPVTPISRDERPVGLTPARVAPAVRPAEAGSRAASARLVRRNPTVLVDVEPQAPIVRVTIGRVDVRAVVTPPQPPRESPSKPRRMTLDEYLARGARL
jgi:hypothetical protein